MFRTKVYFKVLGYFGFLLVVLVAMTWIVTNRQVTIEKEYKSSSSEVQFLEHLERLRAAIVDIPENLDLYAQSKNEQFKTDFDKGLSEFGMLVDAIKKENTDSLTNVSLEQIESLFFEWTHFVGEPEMQLLVGNISIDSVAILKTAIDRIEVDRNYLAQARLLTAAIYEKSLLSQSLRIDNARELGGELTQFIIIVNVLFALFAIALGFILSRSITKPLEQLREGTRNIVESKFVTIDLHRVDEFGQLANEFNYMSAMLNENYTRVKAYSDMMTTLNRNDTFSGVVSESLDLLCQQTHSGVGALYIYKKGMDKLVLAGKFAMSNEHRTQTMFSLGEGIVGECARLQQPLEIYDVAQNTLLSIETGVQSHVPAFTYAFPILFQENLVGILIFGSMQKFSDLTRSLVEGVLPQMGVALTNVQNYEETQELSREISKKHDELNTKTQELEKAYRVKSDFLSNMSHELRTPLNSIIGFSSILLGDRGDPLTDDQRKALEKVLKNGKHLLQLINDILDFSKIESGRMHVSIESDSVEGVINGAIMTAEALIRQKNIHLKNEIVPDLPLFNTDVLKIKQILVNLLSNASKFTDENGLITLRAKLVGSKIRIEVIDSGIGIEPQNLGRIFEEFSQVDSSHSRKYQGTGLGLPIARRLAQLLGGDLTVDSIVGKGSTFSLTIPPVYQSNDMAEVIVSAAPVVPKEISIEQQIKQMDIAALKKDGETRVLCIDDEPDVIEILRKYLVPEGYTVYGANSGDDGIKLAEKLQPSVITLDIMMPKKDGWQVLRELKANPLTQNIPVLIHSMVDNIPLAFSLGAIDYLPKPADVSLVLRTVRKAASKDDKYILVVDDDDDFRSLLVKVLKEEGFSVQTATNGQAAMTKIESSKPSMILLDLSMPVMDGFEVLKKLKQSEHWHSIPVVILTGIDLNETQIAEINNLTGELLKKKDYSSATLSTAIKHALHIEKN
ncbi:MAG: response regulator [Bacteriovoracaceae bacterium]|nr:response regulator [Bacteroidota bacterium]